MSEPRPQDAGAGPFNVTQVRSGDRYELSRGHPVYCTPTGADGARGTVLGAEVLDTDPAVEAAGVDAGFALDDNTLRAPDVSVGNLPDRPGWIRGVPPLAVEYAGTGQHEDDLQEKIEQLLAAGTRWIWVARLVGPRRVEVYERGQPMRTAVVGEDLDAPGVLQNPVPVAALFDREAAHEATLRNLLQRKGFDSIDAIQGEARARGREEGRGLGREEGREEGRDLGREEGRGLGREEGRDLGREEGRAAAERAVLVEAIEALCAVLQIPFPSDRGQELAGLDAAALRARMASLRDHRSWIADDS